MKWPTQEKPSAVELTNRITTGRVAFMIETAITNGARLHMSAEELGGHTPLENNPLEVYRALATTKGVTIAGTNMTVPEKGIGIALTMTVPGATATDTATHFDLTIGTDSIRLPTDGHFLDKNLLGGLLAATNAGHKYDEIIDSVQLVAGTIGLAPLSVTDAANNFLTTNQDYVTAEK